MTRRPQLPSDPAGQPTPRKRGSKDSRRRPGGDQEHTDPFPTARHSGKLGTGPGHPQNSLLVTEPADVRQQFERARKEAKKAKRSIINTNTRSDPEKQSIATPWFFIHALEQRFGTRVDFDLAASSENSKAPFLRYFTEKHDSLRLSWGMDLAQGLGGNPETRLAYLNPPFGNLKPWALKLAECRYLQRWTVMLAPSSFDANWFEYLRSKVLIEPIPRIQFEGQDIVYPKGLALYTAGYGVAGIGAFWDWRVSYRDYCHINDLVPDPKAHIPQALFKKHPPLSVLPDFDWTPSPFAPQVSP